MEAATDPTSGRVRCILRLWPPINSTVRILDVATNVVCDDDIDDAFGPRVSRAAELPRRALAFYLGSRCGGVKIGYGHCTSALGHTRERERERERGQRGQRTSERAR